MNYDGLWKKIAVILLAILMVYSLAEPPWATEMADAATNEEVAESVFEDHGFTFVILGLLLAAAMIGGIFLAKMPRELSWHKRKGKIVVRRLISRRPQRPGGGR